MRLTPEQQHIILQTLTQQAGQSARAYLFGSRLDDRARGGDLDLLIELPTRMTLLEHARLKLLLEARLGLPVDLVVRDLSVPATSFQQIARAQAVLLEPGA
jgi:predicted nucleotidyltransferase